MKIEGAGNFKPTSINSSRAREASGQKAASRQNSAAETVNTERVSVAKQVPSELQAKYTKIFVRLEELQNQYANNGNKADTKKEIQRLLTEMDNLLGGAAGLSRDFVEQVGTTLLKNAQQLLG